MIKNKKAKQELFHYNFFPKNRRGDKILSVYWFAILILSAGGIFAMVYIFYGAPYDIREIEADILANQIADCVSYAGRINSNIISEGNLESCHLIFNSSEWEEEQYYAEVNLYLLADLVNPAVQLKKGSNKWINACELQNNKEYENLAKCRENSFYSLDSSNNQYIIKIKSIVRKSEKNVKL